MAALNKKSPAAPAKKAAAPAPVKKAAPAKSAPAKKPVAKKGAAAARPARPTWDAPADFKPAFFNFTFKTDSQALIIPESVQGQRYKGRWDNENAKTFDLREYDLSTLIGFAARMSAAIWAPNVVRRVTPDASWRIVLRVSKRSADSSLAARIIGVAIKTEGKKAKWFEDKTDPNFRKIRRAARWLPAAFTDVQLPPSTRRKAKNEEDDSEE